MAEAVAILIPSVKVPQFKYTKKEKLVLQGELKASRDVGTHTCCLCCCCCCGCWRCIAAVAVAVAVAVAAAVLVSLLLCVGVCDCCSGESGLHDGHLQLLQACERLQGTVDTSAFG